MAKKIQTTCLDPYFSSFEETLRQSSIMISLRCQFALDSLGQLLRYKMYDIS